VGRFLGWNRSIGNQRSYARFEKTGTRAHFQLVLTPNKRTFKEAAEKYLIDNIDKASIETDARHLDQLGPYINDLMLDCIHIDTLRPFIEARKEAGKKTKTINLALSVVRRILNLAARSWRDERGKTWLQQAPLIELLTVRDAAKPYPLDWDEQEEFFKRLPCHLANMALFKVNTGNREAEVCGLRWEWELSIPDFAPVVFLIPGEKVQGKNRCNRIVVCNDVAARVVDSLRGNHPKFVFSYAGRQVTRMNNTGWRNAWKAAGLPIAVEYLKGPHNLKHTYGRRLRAAGVPKDTRRILLGHRTGDITDHYSVPEIQELYEASNRVCGYVSRKSPALHMVKRKVINAQPT
jgi:integrase